MICFIKRLTKKIYFYCILDWKKQKIRLPEMFFRNGRIRIGVFFWLGSGYFLVLPCCHCPCPRLSQNTIWVLFPPGRQFSDKSHNKSLIYIWDKFLKYLSILSQEMCLRIQGLICSLNLGPFKIFGCLILYEKSIYYY